MIKKRKELEEILEIPLPPGMTYKRNIYHGSNTLYDKLDFDRGGGMVHFAESPGIAWTYANDLGSGSRNKKRWKDIRVEEVDTGENFLYDPESKLWKSSSRAIPHSEFKEIMEEGEGYFEAYPREANVRAGKVDMTKVLNTYPDRSRPFHSRANKAGLEEFLDLVDSSKVQNTVNPQHDIYTKRIVDRLRQAAHDEIKGAPGAPGLGNTLWTTSKWAKAEETNQALKGVVSQLKDAGKEGIRFADDSHPTIAMFQPPESMVKLFKKSVKPVVGGLAVLGALSAPDMAQAAADVLIPGGVESMGVSDEQKKLDQEYARKKYQDRIRTQQRLLNEAVKP